MTRASALALAFGFAASTVHAAGIERSVPTTRALFEPGSYLEFSATLADPELSGQGGFAPVPGVGPVPAAPTGTGDLFDSFATLGFAFKADLTDRLSYAFIIDQPWGVDTTYPTAPGVYSGVRARLDATQLSGILAYGATEAIKVYGGVRAERLSAEASLPFVGGYTIETDTQTNLGYLVGAAYQIPDIAFRVALTYYSAIEHTMNTTEFGALQTRTEIETPQAVNLEFQTGVAEGTLVFGSIRWVDWSEFVIRPPNYPLGTLVDYEKDWVTYTLGVGRRFSDTWSGFVQASHEPASDTVLTTLGPVDGRTSLGLGATWTDGDVSVTAGVTYVWLGEARNLLGTQFDDGTALGVGLRVGYRF
jgi:long-chain fatty acid transport protein